MKLHKYKSLLLQLVISDGELLENMRNLTIFGTDYSFKRLRQKVDKKDWKNHGAAAVVNAYYSPLENSIREYSVHCLEVTSDRCKILESALVLFFQSC